MQSHCAEQRSYPLSFNLPCIVPFRQEAGKDYLHLDHAFHLSHPAPRGRQSGAAPEQNFKEAGGNTETEEGSQFHACVPDRREFPACQR